MRPNVQLLGTAVLLALSQLAVAQPPPPGGAGGPGAGGPGGPMGGTDSVAGQSSSTACPTSATTCAADGSTNYIDRSKLAFDAKTGLFSGSITFNGCPKHKTGPTLSPSCVQQTLPAVTTTPVASALRGAVGYTIYGVNIYGPYEAGFQAGFVCTNGTCDGGIDVPTCRSKLARDCGGVSQLKEEMLHDDCAGHATPYHHHLDLPCDYDITAAGAHSQLVGWALDGRGIYGRWESDGKTPTDLDACNGHYGPVPAITLGGVTYPAASNVYHYHLTADAPYTLGCYGPVTSLSACKSLYSTCGTGNSTICTMNGEINYDTDCPCYRQMATGEKYNHVFTGTEKCPVIEGLTTISLEVTDAKGKVETVVIAETGSEENVVAGGSASASASTAASGASKTAAAASATATSTAKPSSGEKIGATGLVAGFVAVVGMLLA